jgi:hypothetical protein
LLLHVAAVALFWACSDNLVQMPAIASLAPDTQPSDEEEEQDLMVMDVGLPAPPVAQVPTVQPQPEKGTQLISRPEKGLISGPEKGTQLVAARPGPPAATVPSGGNEPLFVPTQAQSVVYVIDRSGSMGRGGRLALARHELLASLERLPPGTRFQIIAYNRFAEPLRIACQSGLVPATAANKLQAALLLEGLPPEGGTEHLAALRQALLLQPEAIYFLTDADDLQPDQVQTLTRLNHGRTIIHTIELTARHRNAPGMPLQVLARENRGAYRGVDLGDQ